MTTGVRWLESDRPRLTRRALLRGGCCGAAVVALPVPARADANAEQIAAWFFERYLLQTISVVRFNVSQVSEEAGKAVEQEAPSLQRFLSKHRPAFMTALVPLIEREIPVGEISAIASEVSSEDSKISAKTRERLVVVDEEFQKSEQKLLRALSYELGVLVERIVANIRKAP